MFEKIKQRRDEKREEKFNPKVAQELYERMKTVSTPQEIRQLHKEMKANGMGGLPLFARYPKVPDYVTIGCAVASAVMLIVKYC